MTRYKLFSLSLSGHGWMYVHFDPLAHTVTRVFHENMFSTTTKNGSTALQVFGGYFDGIQKDFWFWPSHFREEKEKSKKIFSTFERGKRNGFSILKLQEEKEKVKTISPLSRRGREMLNAVPQFWEEIFPDILLLKKGFWF